MGKNIEVGRVYTTKNRDRVTIIGAHSGSNSHRFIGDNGEYYNINGEAMDVVGSSIHWGNGREEKESPQENQPTAGKTLLDEFAMVALGGILVAYPRQGATKTELVEKSYEIATLMLKEKKKLADQ